MKIICKSISTTDKVELLDGNKMLARCYIRKNHGKNFVTLFRMYVPKGLRRKGYGSKLLVEVINTFSDFDIRLSVGSSGEMNDNELIQWYKKHGFVLMTKKTMICFDKRYSIRRLIS